MTEGRWSQTPKTRTLGAGSGRPGPGKQRPVLVGLVREDKAAFTFAPPDMKNGLISSDTTRRGFQLGSDERNF
jgi:hypothetical protein